MKFTFTFHKYIHDHRTPLDPDTLVVSSMPEHDNATNYPTIGTTISHVASNMTSTSILHRPHKLVIDIPIPCFSSQTCIISKHRIPLIK